MKPNVIEIRAGVAEPGQRRGTQDPLPKGFVGSNPTPRIQISSRLNSQKRILSVLSTSLNYLVIKKEVKKAETGLSRFIEHCSYRLTYDDVIIIIYILWISKFTNAHKNHGCFAKQSFVSVKAYCKLLQAVFRPP